MNNSESSKQPKLPATFSEALDAGWEPSGNEGTFNSSNTREKGTIDLENKEFPGLTLSFAFKATYEYSKPHFRGEIMNREDYLKMRRSLAEDASRVVSAMV